jgi:large subunit ribosomal protein L10
MGNNLELKKQVVSEITEKIKNAQSIIAVHYSGLTVEEVTKLRAQCREAGVDYCVLKNTLVRRALDDMDIHGWDDVLEGPTAYAFGTKDAVAPAKIICDFIDKAKNDHMSVKIGLMGTEVMDVNAVKALASLPSREELLARLVGSLNSSIAKLVYVLDAVRKKQAGEE